MCHQSKDMGVFICLLNIFILCLVIKQVSGNPTVKDACEDPYCFGFGSGFESFPNLYQWRDMLSMNKGLLPRKNRESPRIGLKYKRRTSSFCGHTCTAEGLPTCYCDAACRSFRDCCSPSTGLGINDTISSEDTIHDENMVCRGPHRSNKLHYKLFPFGIWMKENCSNEVSKSVSRKCLGLIGNITDDPLVFFPVTDRNGITYPNIFCAICNGAEDASPWDLRAIFKDFKEIQSMRNLSEILKLVNQRSNIVPLPSKFIKPRICVLAEKQTKENSGSSIKELCSSYQGPVYLNGKLFRNINCIENISSGCSALPPTDRCTPKCLQNMDQTYREYATPRFTRPAVIIELGPQFRLERDNTKCKGNNVLQDSEVGCIEIGCLQSPYVPVTNGVCNRYITRYEYTPFEFIWFFTGDVSADKEGLSRYVTMIYYVLLLNKLVSDRDYFAYYYMDSDTHLCKAIVLRLQSKEIITWNEFLKIQNWIKSLQFSYSESIATRSKSFSRVLGHAPSSDCPADIKSFTKLTYTYLAKDLKEIYQSVARYGHSFLLMDNCKIVHLNMSLQMRQNIKGETGRSYKPLQFSCSNGFNLLRNHLWVSMLYMIIPKLFW